MEEYLHQHIPLSLAMGARVLLAGPDGVVLAAPLEPNLNHRSTAFGGSVAAQGILAGWTLVHLRLHDQNVPARTVVQKSEVVYLEPIHGAFEARTEAVDPTAWQRFLRTLDRWGRGRFRVAVQIWSEGVMAARLSADYVALSGTDEED